MTFLIPIRTKNGLNQRIHWAVRAKQVKAERQATRAAWLRAARTARLLAVIALDLGDDGPGLSVTLARIAPRQMDDDNLRGSLKAVRDEVAACLGVDDGDARVTWAYGQERGEPKQYGVRVVIE